MKIGSSKVLVALQFISIIVILLPLTNSRVVFSYWWIFVIISAIFSLWIFTHNRFGNFNIVPEIKDSAKLIVSGPYRYIRHPMYSALILGVFGVMLHNFSIINLLFFILMVLAVVLKAKKEERLWSKHHSGYKDYMKKTKMIIPFIL